MRESIPVDLQEAAEGFGLHTIIFMVTDSGALPAVYEFMKEKIWAKASRWLTLLYQRCNVHQAQISLKSSMNAFVDACGYRNLGQDQDFWTCLFLASQSIRDATGDIVLAIGEGRIIVRIISPGKTINDLTDAIPAEARSNILPAAEFCEFLK